MNKEFSTQYLIKIALRVAGPILIFLCVIYITAIISLHGLSDEVLSSTKDAFSTSGSLGDTINGIFAPLIGGFAVITTFLAFIVQYDANQQIRKDTKIERFENKFYEMLRLHKENVNEIEIKDDNKGRKAFIYLFKELRSIYGTYKMHSDRTFYKLSNKNLLPLIYSESYRQEVLLKIAYQHMFYGVDVDREESNYPFAGVGKEYENDLSKELPHIKSKGGKDRFYVKIPQENVSYVYTNNEKQYHRYYKSEPQPYGGHAGYLGHYYRHIFQMVKFVAQNDFLSFEEKYDYIKMLRGQLSNHEQALIFYNAVWLDKDTWWYDEDRKGNKHSYLLDFALIKNVTFNVTDQIGPEIVRYFKDKFEEVELIRNEQKLSKRKVDQKLKTLFEWDISNRL